MENTARLILKRDRLKATIARLGGDRPDATTQVAKHFHLGTVGGSGRNTASLNRKREACMERTINRAVEYCAAVKELQWVEGNIRYIETTPQREAMKIEVKARMTARGEEASRGLKPGDQVRWIVSGTTCTVVRVNRTSVTVEMCGGVERLKFEEIAAA